MRFCIARVAEAGRRNYFNFTERNLSVSFIVSKASCCYSEVITINKFREISRSKIQKICIFIPVLYVLMQLV